jgi:hypothetical protein
MSSSNPNAPPPYTPAIQSHPTHHDPDAQHAIDALRIRYLEQQLADAQRIRELERQVADLQAQLNTQSQLNASHNPPQVRSLKFNPRLNAQRSVGANSIVGGPPLLSLRERETYEKHAIFIVN